MLHALGAFCARPGGSGAKPAIHLASNDELLLALPDGSFKPVRDDSHVDPHAIFVWDSARSPVIESVEILELLGRYPCGGKGCQWSHEDFLAILGEKRNQDCKSIASRAISSDDRSISPACGTVALAVSPPEHPRQ
jgi:hypothetical protein